MDMFIMASKSSV